MFSRYHRSSPPFEASKGIDFKYDLDRAIEEGHVCDFIITVPVGPADDMEAMGRFLVENKERLAPMLVVLNRVERARACAEVLSAKGLKALAVCAKMDHPARHEAKQAREAESLGSKPLVN